MTERGTSGAGRPQITGVLRGHRFFKLAGRGTSGDDIRLARTQGGYIGIRPLTPPVGIHGSMVANGAKLFPHWTKSWLGWRPACWTPVKAKPKNCLMLGAGDSGRDQMSLRQQLRRRDTMRTSHREMPCSRRFFELVLCKE